MDGEDELYVAAHALQRMTQRGISKEDIIWALRREVRRSPGQPGSIWIHGQPAGNRILKVCVRTGDERFVITAVWED